MTHNFGQIVSYSPHFIIIVIAADQDIARTTHDEYMGIAMALRIPMIVIVTKTDIESPNRVLK